MIADTLREMIRDAARTAFSIVRRRQPDERFYVFALQSFDDASGVYAHANTEEGYQRTLVQRRTEHWRFKAQVEQQYLRWCRGEWDHQNVEFPLFAGVYEFNNTAKLAPLIWWVVGRAAMFAAMVGALADLDAEGMFGRDGERERVTLFCTVHDSYCREWVEKESAARLNPPQVSRVFAPSDVMPDEEHHEIYDVFVRQLEEWRLPRQTEPGN